MKSFLKVRQPLGARVDARDVYNDLPDALRIKVCLRTVRERLKDKGFIMQDKLTKDDMGEAWRMKRMEFCRKHLSKSPSQWANFVQAVGDFRYFTYYPRNLKKRYLVKSCTQTIMRKGERRNKPAFFRPRKQIFKALGVQARHEDKSVRVDHIYRADLGYSEPIVSSSAGLDQDGAAARRPLPQERLPRLEGVSRAP